MKKILFLLTIGMLASWNIQGQDQITLSWEGNQIGDTVHMYYEGTPEEMVFHAILTNTTDHPVSLMAVRKNEQVLDSTSNYFCWIDLCYPPFVDTSNVALPLDAGASCSDADFKTGYSYITSFNNEVVGSSYVRYKFYDEANPDIYGEVVVRYEFGHVGVDDILAEAMEISNIYPNPASNVFHIDYKLPSNNHAQIILINILGEVVREDAVHGSGSLIIDASDLKQGMYYCSMITEGRNHITRKVVIQK